MSVADYWFNSEDGLRLYARVYPGPGADAPVLVCLHGLMRNGADFEELAAQFAGRFRVIVPDVRGRGRSARDPQLEHYQLPVYLRDLGALTAGLGAERFSIVGTSMGGLMGMVLAATEPARVVRLVLNDIGPEVDPRGLERIRSYAGRAPAVASWPEAIAQVRSIYSVAWPGLSETRWEQIARRSYRADADGIPRADADPLIGEATRRTVGAAPDLWPLWGAITVPVLAIRGALSDVLSTATLARMQRERPDLTVITVADRGHPPLLDEPECLAALNAFL